MACNLRAMASNLRVMALNLGARNLVKRQETDIEVLVFRHGHDIFVSLDTSFAFFPFFLPSFLPSVLPCFLSSFLSSLVRAGV